MYPVMNVSHWEKDTKRNASGTREKFYLFHPETRDSFLFKIPMENTGEAWAEKVASELGMVMGFEMMDVSFAIYNERLGVLLRNFVKLGEEEFFDGGDLLKAVMVDFHPKSLNGYNILNIVRAIEPYREYNIDKGFVEMLVFDALIANQDRHCENWGLIQSNKGVRLAPFFDNGASLGFNLSEDRVNKMLRDRRMFQGFTRRSKSLIAKDGNRKKSKMLTLLKRVFRLYPEFIMESLQSFDRLCERNIDHILNNVPSSIMPLLYKEWVRKLILYRKEWLKAELEEKGNDK